MPSAFVTGTDTGIGKTVLVAALIAALRRRGVDAVPMKPVQTGSVRRDGKLIAPDIEFCLSMAGLNLPEEQELMSPYRFEPACSPHLAAAIAGKPILMTKIIRSCTQLQRRHACVLVEGAGGVLVPFNEDDTMLDFIVALHLPVVLAARSGLGTLNHTLLSLHELRRSRREVLGVVFVDTQPGKWTFIEEDNFKRIRTSGEVPVVCHLPYFEGLHEGRVRREDFALTAENALGPLVSALARP